MYLKGFCLKVITIYNPENNEKYQNLVHKLQN